MNLFPKGQISPHMQIKSQAIYVPLSQAIYPYI